MYGWSIDQPPALPVRIGRVAGSQQWSPVERSPRRPSPPIPSTLTSEIDTTMRTVITVFFKPCREPESSGRSNSARTLRSHSRPVVVEAVVAEPLTPPEIGPRSDVDRIFAR